MYMLWHNPFVFPFLVLSISLIGNIHAAVPVNHTILPDCRCRPGDTCWPTSQQWDAFNRTTNGNLRRLRPIGAVCHGDEYNEENCRSVNGLTYDPLWRIANPAAYQWTNWESDEGGRGHAKSCPLDTRRNSTCSQGRIPLYAIMAGSVQDVQSTLLFARQHNIRVTIRNTGHDGTGRFSGAGSVQINVSRLKRMQFTDTFIPLGGDRSHSEGPAVTVGAGVLGFELLRAAQERGMTAVTGVCKSVGVVGGFLQGGGTSLLAPAYGMAADNALQFTVVTAQGDLVVANKFQNSDLFWALRGGGGGTFGVIIEATIRTFPDTPAVYTLITAAVVKQNGASPTAEQSLWEITAEITNLLPGIKRHDDKTSAIIVPVILADSVALTAAVLMPNTSDVATANQHFKRLRETLEPRAVPYTLNITSYRALSTYLNEPGPMHTSGIGQVEGSVLISEKLFLRPNGTSELVQLLSRLQLKPGDSVEILMSAGGRVKANRDVIDSALLPAWRDSALLVTIRRNLPPDSTTKRMRNSQLPFLRGLEDSYMGSYLNVADPDEPGFRNAFWGENYGRLYEVKERWDPDGLFVVGMGVGSEDWDEEVICRVQQPRWSL
ncbi:hypothetical protein BJX64DRAFT_48084 [Aspergillus heterothallicus]